VELVLPAPETELKREAGSEGPTVVAVLSGKGGVGKTIVSTNLAVALASEHSGVLLMDCDLSAGQSHILLGLCPSSGLAQVVRGEKNLGQIMISAGNGLTLAPGGPSGGSALELEGRQIKRLVTEAGKAAPSAHALMLDAGPGHKGALGDFVDAADIVLVVCTPEPTAIRATVAMLEVMLTERPDAKPYLLVNMASSRQDAQYSYERIKDALLPVFTAGLRFFGWLPYDLEVTRSLWRYRPIVKDTPRSRAARGFGDLRSSLVGLMGNGWQVSTALDDDGTVGPLSADQDDSDQARAA
jgi:flagellar biosynthesis protein FlhG